MKIIKANENDKAGCVKLRLDEPSFDPDIFWMQQGICGISLDTYQVANLIPELNKFLAEARKRKGLDKDLE